VGKLFNFPPPGKSLIFPLLAKREQKLFMSLRKEARPFIEVGGIAGSLNGYIERYLLRLLVVDAKGTG
jgi:hypothetical protein